MVTLFSAAAVGTWLVLVGAAWRRTGSRAGTLLLHGRGARIPSPEELSDITTETVVPRLMEEVALRIVGTRAQKLIRSLDGLTYREGTSQPMKNDLEHITSAFDYLLWQEFRVLGGNRPAVFEVAY